LVKLENMESTVLRLLLPPLLIRCKINNNMFIITSIITIAINVERNLSVLFFKKLYIFETPKSLPSTKYADTTAAAKKKKNKHQKTVFRIRRALGVDIFSDIPR